MNKIPIHAPYFVGNEKKYLNDIIDTGWIASRAGYVDKFEQAFCNKFGFSHAVSLCNATGGLHLALKILGVRPGDKVIVPSIGYIATINCVLYNNATPVVCNINDNLSMNLKHLNRLINVHKIKSIVIGHIHGHPSDMDAIRKTADLHNISIIEDCAEGIGTKFNNRYLGSWGDISVFSFHSAKTINTGEGGILVSNNKYFADEAFKLKNHCMSSSDPYIHDGLGYNYRMNGLSAAVGLAQIEKFDEILDKKQQIYQQYNKLIKTGRAIPQIKGTQIAPWLYPRYYNNIDKLRATLNNANIETRNCFKPFLRIPHCRDLIFNNEVDPIAERITDELLCIPCHANMTIEQAEYISGVINNA